MKKSTILILAGAAVALVVGAYAASPVLAAWSLKGAMAKGDSDGLEALVDFPSVRENLKADLTAEMATSMQNDPEMQNNPFAGLGLALAPMIVDRMVDSMVTPANLSRLAERAAPTAEAPSTQPTGPAARSGKNEPKTSFAYAGPNRFKIKQTVEGGKDLTWILERRGLFGWKLIRIDLPKGLLTPPSAATPAA